MKPEAKLKGNSTSELTKFKRLWRDDLSEFDRDSLRSLFLSTASNAQIRAEVKSKHGIKLHRDDQVTAFREWEMDQRQRDLEMEQMAEDERRALEEHPDWTLDQAREDVLRKALMRATTRGDFKLGMEAVRESRADRMFSLDKKKFEFSATKAALAKLPELKAIASNKALSDDEKLEQARLALFGVAPQ